ncbi:MAG: S8 family serine peptidase, partial [Myxococcales bacterium]|nr:S8 family serine peptidase [Myxococcales bacterium]
GSWGQPYADLWGPDAIRAPEVWPFAQGEGAVVAVVDSGVDQQHPDLAANLWVNPGEDLDGNGRVDPTDLNGIDDDGNGFIDDLTGFDFANSIDANGDGDFDDPGDVSDADPQDDNGHGTHVAGTAVAVADNGLGIVGIAPRARVMALKGFPASGSASDSVLWRAVLYAAENGATVVNNSWS